MKRQTINDFNTKMILERWKLGDNSWGNWEIIYTDAMLSNSKQMGSLASALGGVVTTYNSSAVQSLDSIVTAGSYFINNDGAMPSNTPTGVGSCHLNVSNTVGNRVVQSLIDAATGVSYRRIRTSSGTTWSSWLQMTN